MATPIKLTSEVIEKAVAEFRAKIEKYKASDGKLKYESNLPGSDDKATVTFTPKAYAKMLSLVQGTNDEIAWHGISERIQTGEYVVKDIIVYPQIVASATVKTDDAEYAAWQETLDDEQFNNVRMQGHSHVTFGVTPSTTDTNNQEDFLSQLTGNDYYIFLIWNKRNEHWCKIYDMQANIMYNTSDIKIRIEADGEDLDEFVEQAKKMVRRESVTTTTKTTTTKYQSYQTGKSVQLEKPKESFSTFEKNTSVAPNNSYGLWSEEQYRNPFYYNEY